MRVLGIDPGIERLGWGIIEKTQKGVKLINSGVKTTSKTQSNAKRLLELHNFIDSLIKTERLDSISIEKIFFSKNVKTALIIGEVRGVVLTVAEKYRLLIKEFAPSEVKMTVCGYGRASKSAVTTMLHSSLALPKRKMLDDETDALAVALCGIYHKEFT